MLLDVVTQVLPQTLVEELEALHPQLLAFCGHRSIWLDEDGRLWHAEPDELLEDLGHIYVGTFFRPGLEELSIAVSRAYPKPMRPQGRLMPPPVAAATEQAATA